MLTEAQKVQVRRHLGYPVTGLPIRSPAGGAALNHGFQGYRFLQVYGQLEFRMNWLQPVEEAVITGLAFAYVQISSAPGVVITPGADLSIQLVTSDGEIDETLEYTTQAGDTIFTIGSTFANLLAMNGTLTNAGFVANAPFTNGVFTNVTEPVPGIQLISPRDFTTTVVYEGDATLIVAPGGGVPQDPIIVVDDGDTTIIGLLPILSYLQGKIASSSDNLDTERADVWFARKDEVTQRKELYHYWRNELAKFLDIPLFENTGHGAVNRFKPGNGGIMVA